MIFDNGFDDDFGDELDYEESGFDDEEHQAIEEQEESEEDFDSLDITGPKDAFFFLSDDVQDEISGNDKKKMKCNSCGHMFTGDLLDDCSECFSPDTEEIIDETESEEDEFF